MDGGLSGNKNVERNKMVQKIYSIGYKKANYILQENMGKAGLIFPAETLY
jgi:thermostable 8-oxoguanine DNA glycosylase